jgi:hypothetical protein
MTGPQQFRVFAEACVQMAKESGPSGHRSRLMDMAEAWRRLAEEAERFEQLVREVDQAFDAPSPQEFRPYRRPH